MSVSAIWKDKLAFEGHNSAGFSLPLDSNKASGGDENGFRPTELLLLSLAACTGMDVISILQKKRQEVSSFEVRVSGERATEHPRVYTDLQVEYVLRGSAIDPQAVTRAVELSQNKYCTVYAMLSKAAKITYKITIE